MRTEPTKQTETKIYTRKGDLGQTSLFGGEKVFKDDLRVQTYGSSMSCRRTLDWPGL